jgi:tRNA pseudouridine55 synthase
MANLTQLKMLEDLNGLLLIDKPVGLSFTTVVKTVKRKFNLVKVGHGGSLDPSASGLLILLLNDANRFTGDVMGADRLYSGSMRLGLKTNTHDIYGEEIKNFEVPVDFSSKASQIMSEFKGDVFQTESRWCSVRREGSAGYEVADTGEHKPFLAHVYKFELGDNIEGSSSLQFTLSATKGLIVRTLINDFGDAVGCGAALESLRRLKVGRWSVDEAIAFDKLLELEMSDLSSLIKPFTKEF